MIETMTEKEYRALSYNSSSSLKDFSLDRKKYYRKYILGDKIKEKPNPAADMGRLVETLLMEPERFDDLFFMSSCVKVPGGMLGDFIYKLAELVARDSEKEGFDFEEVAKEAYVASGFKIKFETVLSKLDNPENKIYYEECLKVEHLGMTMITVQQVENAERIVDSLRTTSHTSNICNLEGEGLKYSVFNQMKIQEYSIDGMLLKSMLDKVIVDHKYKKVFIYDLKCTWSVESFYKEYYLYRRAYIQAFLYYNAVKFLSTDPTCKFYGYEVEPTKFIVCDSINYFKPLIYTLTHKDLKEAYEGFTYKHTEYQGVKQIIEECLWALEQDIWDISKKNFDMDGVINIKG